MPAAPSCSASTISPLHVLIVEDDLKFRDALSTCLARRGHAITNAATRTEALRAIATSAFEVVVTDVLLPDGDGIDVINRIQALGRAIRVIAMTGGSAHLGPEFFSRIAEAFGAVMLQKPFGAQEFVNAVEASTPTPPDTEIAETRDAAAPVAQAPDTAPAAGT